MTEQRVDQSMFALTCAGVNGEAGGFIGNDEIVVFEEYLERNRLRSHVDLLHRRLSQTNFVTAPDNVPRPGGLLVKPNGSAADQLLETRARILRKSRRQKLIKAQPRDVFSYDKLDWLRIFQCFGSRSEQEHEQE